MTSESLAIRLLDIHKELGRDVKRGEGAVVQGMGSTASLARVSDLAHEEADRQGDRYVGTEHLLLGLAREEEGLAGRVLRKLGADDEHLRLELRAMQAGKERLVQRVKNRFLQVVEKDTALPVRALLAAAMTRDPSRVAEEILSFLALSPGDREALQSLQSPRERLEKLSRILETGAVSLVLTDHPGHEKRS